MENPLTTPEPTAPTTEEETPSASGKASKPEEAKNPARKNNLLKVLLGLFVIAVVGVLIAGVSTDWKFGATPPNFPDLPADTVPLPGGLTYEELQEEVETSPPGSAIIAKTNTSVSSTGWSVLVTLVNLSPAAETFTVVVLDSEGEELNSRVIEMPPSYIDAAQVYLPMDFKSGEVTVRVDGITAGEGIAEQKVTIGTP